MYQTYDWIPNEEQLEQVSEFRRTMPELVFKSEYLGYWLELESEIFGDFSKNLISKSNNPQYNKTYFGIDWSTGIGEDDTVVSVLNDNSEQIDLVYINNCDIDEQLDIIEQLSRKYNPEVILVEKNSIGNIYYSLLVKNLKNSNIKEFITTNDTKREIIDDMKARLEQETLWLLDDNKLINQLQQFEQRISPTGKVIYGSKHKRDDAIIATALSVKATQIKKSNKYIISIN